MIPVIGVAGRAKVGKDTVGRFIIGAGAGRYTYALAEPIRNMLFAGFGVDLRSPYWASRKEEPIPAFGKSPREMLQTLGTEWGRTHIGEGVWILLAQEKLLNMGGGMVITDIRFPNEAAWVRRMGGTVVHVLRDVPAVHAHSSED